METTAETTSSSIYKFEGDWDKFEKEMNEDFNEEEVNGELKELRDGFKADCEYIKAKGSSLTKKEISWLKQWSKTYQDPQMSRIEGFNVKDLDDESKKGEIFDSLLLEAQKARISSYSPYSHFQVGTAILLADGTIVHGCNVENAAYGSTNCAERTAIFTAAAKINRGISIEKKNQIKAIALVLRDGGTPCGACRQVLYEFNPDMIVIKSDIDGKAKKVYDLDYLLPEAFGPKSLR